MANENSIGPSLNDRVALVVKSLGELSAANFPVHELAPGSKILEQALSLTKTVQNGGPEGPSELIKILLPLADAMVLAQQSLLKSAKSLLECPAENLSALIVCLLYLAQVLSSLMTKVCILSRAFSERNYASTAKGTLHKLASSLTFSSTAVAIFNKAAKAPSFRSEANLKNYAWALHLTLCIVEAEMALFTSDSHLKLAPDALAEIDPLTTQQVLGCKIAIKTMNFCIESLRNFPGGRKSPYLLSTVVAPFFRAWDAVCLNGSPNHMVRFVYSMSHLSAAGMSLYVDYFCQMVDSLISGSDNGTSNAGGGTTGGMESSNTGTTILGRSALAFCSPDFWMNFGHLSSEQVFTTVRSATSYLAKPEVQTQLLTATTSLQDHLAGKGSSTAGPESAEFLDQLHIHATVLAAQTACYSMLEQHTQGPPPAAGPHGPGMRPNASAGPPIMVPGLNVPMSEGMPERPPMYSMPSTYMAPEAYYARNFPLGSKVPRRVSVPEVAKWLGPTARAMTKVLQDVAKMTSGDNIISILRVVDVATPILFAQGYRTARNAYVMGTVLDRTAVIHTAEELNTILRCTTNLMILDMTLAELKEEVQFWKLARGLQAPFPLLPQLVASSMFLFTTLSNYKWAGDIENVREAALAALDAAVKCKITFCTLPMYRQKASEDVLELVKSVRLGAVREDDTPSRDTWLKCIETAVTGPYIVLTKALAIGPDSPEEERMLHAGAVLSMLRASAKFDAELASDISPQYYAISLSSLVRGLRSACAKGSVLLPSDLSALKALRRQLQRGEATLPDNTGRVLIELHNVELRKSVWMYECDEEESIRGPIVRALHDVQDLIKIAAKAKKIPRIRRSLALYTRPCCNPECVTISKDMKRVPWLECAACRKQHYCSAACQKACWKEHKLVCSILAEDD